MPEAIDQDYVAQVTEAAAAAVVDDLSLLVEPGERALEAVLWAIDETLPGAVDRHQVLTAEQAVLHLVGRAIAIARAA